MKLKQNKSEAQIQKEICFYLQILENKKELIYWRENSLSGVLLNKSRNGRTYKSYIKNSKKGKPDIYILKEGRSIFLEVKTEKGKQSEYQKDMEDQINKMGGEYHIVRSVEDVMQAISAKTT